jgi:acetylornithine deacetylase/succinyl-diaminopimelate desuccinylase-like protein
MMKNRRPCLLAPLLCVAVCARPVIAQDATRLTTTISAIAAGQGSDDRRTPIVARVRELGLDARLQPFGDGARAGTNVIVTVPGREPRTILIGAHYDRVQVGQGAVDNGGSCAALLELMTAFKASPLGRYTLTFVFFDREENGLLGSKAYFAANADRPAYAMNLDIFAYGNEIFATASKPDGALMRELRAAAGAIKMTVRDAPVERYPGSDHRSMIAAGIETLGLAIVDTADIDGVLATGGPGLRVGQGPHIMSIIHTPNDTMAEVRVADIVRAIPILERTIRALDRMD